MCVYIYVWFQMTTYDLMANITSRSPSEAEETLYSDNDLLQKLIEAVIAIGSRYVRS